ncbi:hypothetical protein [Alicyclobacillus sp. SP_1]|uniref:hypothetical protein n=1 Tax=Alicyclobacillus sp. SP_1 TaxID=2942475 RepID=UPI002157CB5B|nr:hypothetical protein [Alicyclobacillus sp. SP_1]
MKKLVKTWMTTNRPYMRVAKVYFSFSTLYELTTDLFIPALLGACFFIFSLMSHATFDEFSHFSISVLSLGVTVIAILAGFNVASMAMIGAAPGSFIKNLAKVTSNTEINVLEGLMSMFAWAVLVQIIVLVLSLIYFSLTRFFAPFSLPHSLESGEVPVFDLFFSIGIFIALHSLFLSARNVTAIFKIIVRSMEENERDNES